MDVVTIVNYVLKLAELQGPQMVGADANDDQSVDILVSASASTG